MARRKKNKRYSKNEFRFNLKTAHYNYIFEEDGNNYHALGLTSHSRTKDRYGKYHSNMPLTKNPQQNKTKKSYVRYGYITQNKGSFGRVQKGFSFSSADKSNIKSKIRFFKRRRRTK